MDIVIISIGITGLVFLVIAFVIRGIGGSSTKNEIQTSGTLVGFRHRVYEPGVDTAAYDSPEYEDIIDNIPVSYPIIEFKDNDNGNTIVKSAELPNDWLAKQDIGRQLDISVNKTKRGGSEIYRIHLSDVSSQKERVVMQNKLFWVFTIIALALFSFTIYLYVVQ